MFARAKYFAHVLIVDLYRVITDCHYLTAPFKLPKINCAEKSLFQKFIFRISHHSLNFLRCFLRFDSAASSAGTVFILNDVEIL